MRTGHTRETHGGQDDHVKMEAEIQVTLSLTAYRQQTPGPLEAGKGRG